MHSTYLCVIIATSLLGQMSAEKRCDASICNYESLCFIKDGEPTCDCVGGVFEGEFCKIPRDFCAQENPCSNGGTCHPYLGHYFCECPPGYSGQRCTTQKDVFKGLHLHYNRLAPVGIQQSMLLMLESLGSVEILMDFYTSDYIIDGGAFTSTSGHFRPSNNLRAVSERLRIRNSEHLPYNEGFYRIVHGTFWKLGTIKITVDLSDMDMSAEVFFGSHFDIFIYDPSGVRCLPVIHLPNCANPRRALHMDTVTFNFIEPIVDKRCAQHSTLKFKWSVRNYIDTGKDRCDGYLVLNCNKHFSVVLHKFPEEASTVLTIPPYTMWFNFRDDYVQSYLIQGDVTEANQQGRLLGNTVVRCYVFMSSKPVTPRIMGGPHRDVNYAKEVIIDGSISRDYARHPNDNQQLEYAWSCKSDDTTNPHCRVNMARGSFHLTASEKIRLTVSLTLGPRLRIPPRSLKLGESYFYALTVTSTINIYSSDRNIQVIKVVSENPLLISFRCLRNCEQNMFAAGKIIHLTIDCIGCPPGQVTYSVVNEKETEIANTRSVILTEESKKKVSLSARVTIGSRKGETTIQLSMNSPPGGGSCSTSPTSGVEYQTVFEISCPGYTDDEQPITYTYRAGNTTLDRSGNSTLSTRLYPTSGQNCEIKISVCDFMGACVEVKLQATLSPISPNGSWLDLLSQEGSNLNQLIENGDRSAAISLIRSVIPHLSADDSFGVASHIVGSLRRLELGRLLLVEQVLTVGNDLFEALELSSDSAMLVSEVFSSVSDGLLHSIRNGEVDELSLDTHEQMIGELSQSISKATEEAEEFSLVHDAEPIPPEDRFSENYPDYGELDMEEVVHISNWLASFTRMHKCLQVMGLVSAFIQLPDEPSIIIKRNGVTSMSLVINKAESTSLSWNDSTTFVSLPDEFLRSLRGTEIALQVSIFQENPFWWNPEQYKMNTEVLSVGAYTKDLRSLDSSSTRVPFSFFMELKNGKEIEELNVTHGSVTDHANMEIYERAIPPNAILVVVFMAHKRNLRVLLTIGERPRSYMLPHAHKVDAYQKNSTFLLTNNQNRELKSYLAIVSDSPTNFSFVTYARMCLTWNPKTFDWTSQHCSVGSETNSTHIHCSCSHLSMFGAKVHPTFSDLRAPSHIVENLPINFGLIGFHVFLTVFLSVLKWLAWQWDTIAANGVVVLNSKPGRRAKCKYLVTIFTNGHGDAGTTSNVTIQFHGSLSNSPEYILYSGSSHPLFHRMAQMSFAIRSETSLGVLQSVSLRHDSFGRYPSWNCHIIRVRDDSDQKEYIFLVNKWLSDTKSNSYSAFVPLATSEELLSRRQIFRDTLSDACANWYAQQNICSMRFYCTLTATERTSIFILRVCITVVITLFVFGPTTLFNYEEERETYYSMLLDFGTVITMCVFCHSVGVLASIPVCYLYLKLRPNQKKVKYTLMFR